MAPRLVQVVDSQEQQWQGHVQGALADPITPFEEHWRLFQATFAERPLESGPPRSWWPNEDTLAHANVTQLMQATATTTYGALHKWSVDHRGEFWQAMIERLALKFAEPPQRIRGSDDAESPQWLQGAQGNAASWCFAAPPDRIAIVEAIEGSESAKHITYGELHELARQFAAGLQGKGFGDGDGVALYMPMTTECVAAYLGAVLAGCHVVSIPDSFAPPEIATRLRLGNAKLVVTVDQFLRGGRSVQMAPKVHDALREGETQAGIITVGQPKDGETAWHDFLGPSADCQVVNDPLDRTSNVLFSSGTTGEPKAIPWTHLTPLKAAVDGHLHQDIHEDDVVAWPTNIGWMMGPWLIYATFVNQATMFLYQGVPTSSEFIEAANMAEVTVFGVVPAIVRAWKEQGIPPHALPKVRVWSSTGEASNAHDYLYLTSLAGHQAPVIEYCGGTEIGGGHLTGAIVQPASPATFTTPALGLDFVILGEDGQDVPDGGMGEIFLIPPSIGLSEKLLNKNHHDVYYAGVPADSKGRLLRRHGDQVQRLHGGFWAPQGRADDAMNLGGIKVGSIELETCMNEHPAVSETAAVAVSPPGGGADRLVVFAVLAGNAPADLKAELQARIKQGLNPLFRIQDVVIVEKLPRTASNKVMRRELRAQYSPAA